MSMREAKGSNDRDLAFSSFLSRLFGGEAFYLLLTVLKHFLSRLFGGEEAGNSTSGRLIFLSRLFGGEDTLAT